MKYAVAIYTILWGALAQADNAFTVNTGSDAAIATDCAGTVPDCTSGSCTLRQAAFAATCSGVKTVITLAVPTVTVTAGPVSFGCDSAITTFGCTSVLDLTIQGNAASPSIITTSNGSSLLDFAVEATPVTLVDLHLTGGGAKTLVSTEGGAITRESESGSPGALVLNVTHCTFDNNTAQDGGAIQFGGTLNVTLSTFANNSALDNGNKAYGGALYMRGYSAVGITTSSFTSNTAAEGGGAFYDANGGSNGTFSASDSLFANNSVTASGAGVGGGAIYTTSIPVDLHNVTFFQNQAAKTAGFGGAIYASDDVTMNNVTMSGNDAWQGGAIYMNASSFVTFTTSNSVISGNAFNVGNAECNFVGGLSNVSTGYNLLGKTCVIAIAGPGDLVSDSPGLASTLGATTPTQTLALLAGSPAIDAGNSTAPAANAAPKCEPADQRGLTRPQGAACDIGAYEYTPGADVGVVKTASANPVQGQPIVFTLLVTNAGPDPATTVTVTDNLPSGVSGCTVQPPSSCALSAGAVTCQIGSLPANGSVAFVVSCTAATAGALVNMAQTTHGEPDPNPGNDTSTTTSTVAAPPVAAACGQTAAPICPSVLTANVDCAAAKACAAAIQNGSFVGTTFVAKGCSQAEPSLLLFVGLVLWWRRRRVTA